MSDTTGADTSKTLLVIYEGTKLPHQCFACGNSTERFVRMKEGKDAQGDLLKTISYILALVTFRVFYIAAMENNNEKSASITIKIPQCESCAKINGAPKPSHIDFATQGMTFIVDKSFYEQARSMR